MSEDESSTISSLSTFTKDFQREPEEQKYQHRPPSALMACASEVILETLGDTGDVISTFLKNSRATVAISSVKDSIKKRVQVRDEEKKQREVEKIEKAKQQEEERKLRRQIKMHCEIVNAREECQDVARLWRQGY